MNRILVSAFLLLSNFYLSAQSVYAPLSAAYNHTIDRMEILNGVILPDLHTSTKPYLRKDIAQSIIKDNPFLSPVFSSIDFKNLLQTEKRLLPSKGARF
jgi:predicted metal-dependent RNase